MKPLNKNRKGSALKRPSFYLVLFVCCTCVLILVLYSVFQNEESVDFKDDQLVTEEITVELPKIPEQIIPTEEIRFFSREKGQALSYYAIVNDSVNFFKTQG